MVNKKKLIATVTACGLVAAMSLGGALAYLTDNEAHTNSVMVSGNVRIDLVEPNWSEVDADNDGVPDRAEEAVPNQEISKDPSIINTGENDAVVFLRVTVPVKDVTRVLDNGTLVYKTGDAANGAAYSAIENPGASIYHQPQDIFYFKDANAAITDHTNTWHNPTTSDKEGWVRLSAANEYNTEKPSDSSGNESASNWNKQNVGQAVYVFGYTRVLRGKDRSASEGAQIENASGVYDQTKTLFDKIQVKNIIENEIASDQIQNIKVEAFAIQADNILNASGKILPESGFYSNTKLNEIYNIFVKQNGAIDGADHTGNAINGTEGDMIWSTWQDGEHGQVEKEAEISNERDLNNTTARKTTTFDETKTKVGKTDILVGEKTTMVYDFTSVKDGEDKSTLTVNFESSDPSVATVNLTTGEITGVKKGDATITAYVFGETNVRCSVHITVLNDSREQTPDLSVDVNDNSDIPNGTTEP